MYVYECICIDVYMPFNFMFMYVHVYLYICTNWPCLWDLDFPQFKSNTVQSSLLDFPRSNAHHTSKQLRVISRRGPIQPRKPKNQGHQQGHNLSIYNMFWYQSNNIDTDKI